MARTRPILIAGPTATGKSALALALAEHCRGMIINADSMQVYRELRVLTARPDAGEEARAPHRLYGHVPACEAYSVARWLEDVRLALAEADQLQLRPIIVGGTGLYFKALAEGLSPVPAIPNEVRRRWRAVGEGQGAAGLARGAARVGSRDGGAARPQRFPTPDPGAGSDGSHGPFAGRLAADPRHPAD